MNRTEVLLPGSRIRAIGTEGLNGCSCVVLIGTAILLAHIAPFPGQWKDTAGRDLETESHIHHESALENITTLVRQNPAEFSPNTTAWGIFAYNSQDGHMTKVMDQIKCHLAGMGYTMNPAFYKELDPRDVSPPKGELVGLLDNERHSRLILERQQLWPLTEGSASAAGAVATSSRQPTTAPVSTVPAAYSNIASGSQEDLIRRAAIMILCKTGLEEDEAASLFGNYEVAYRKEGKPTAVAARDAIRVRLQCDDAREQSLVQQLYNRLHAQGGSN